MTPPTLLLALLASSFAYDPVFEKDLKVLPEDAEAEIPEIERHLKAGLGGVYGTGNARYLTMTSTLDGAYRKRRNRIALAGNGQYASAVVDTDGDGTVVGEEGGLVLNSRMAQGQLRYDRFVSPRTSLYALLGGLHDPFKGLRGRANARLGSSRHLVDTVPFDFHGAIGVDLAREWFMPAAVEQTGIERDDILAGMVYQRINWRLTDNTTLMEEAEALVNVEVPEDIRVNARAALTTTLSTLFSTQIAVDLRFDNVPAAPGYAKTDVVTTVSLIANVL